MRVLYSVSIATIAVVLSANLDAQQVRISKEQIPQPVMNAIEALVPGGTFGAAKKETDKDGTIKYQVDVGNGGSGVRLTLSPEGKLYERSENPKFADLPVPVKKTIESECSGPPDVTVKVTPAGSQPYYKFRVTRSVAADGSLSGEDFLGMLTEVKQEDLPQSVVKAIDKLDPGAEYLALKLGGNKTKYEESYEIRAHNAKFFVLSPDGKLYESWDLSVKVADLPGAVKKVVQAATAGGNPEPENLIKIMPIGKEPYYMFRLNRSVAEDGSVIAKKQGN